MKLSFSIEGRCLRHGVGTPTIKRRVGERERACVTEPYCIGEGERKVVVVVDFLVTICPCPVLAAAAPAFFFSLSSSLMLACVSMWHRRKEIVKWQQLFNDFRRQFFLFFLQSACQTFARKDREDFVSDFGFLKMYYYIPRLFFFSFLNEKKGDLGWPSYVSGVSFSDLIYLFSSFPCANVMTR